MPPPARGSSEMTRILIHHQADPQAASDDGTTAAQLAEIQEATGMSSTCSSFPPALLTRCANRPAAESVLDHD